MNHNDNNKYICFDNNKDILYDSILCYFCMICNVQCSNMLLATVHRFHAPVVLMRCVGFPVLGGARSIWFSQIPIQFDIFI